MRITVYVHIQYKTAHTRTISAQMQAKLKIAQTKTKKNNKTNKTNKKTSKQK